MSLVNKEAATFNLGIIASKNLDDPEFLNDLLGEKLDKIGHLFLNGANSLVTDFARENGVTYTVFPINKRSLPWSNSRIIESSDFVFIIASDESKSAKSAEEECQKRAAKEGINNLGLKRKFAYKVVGFEPISHWRDKICKISEVLAATTKEDLEKSSALKAIYKIV
jgi:hypothetical protein